MTRFADRALVLKRWAFGESSLVVHVATRDHGRVHLLAKGAYRTTSRFYAVLDLFDTLELEWSSGRGQELGTLRSGTLAVRRRRIAADLARYRAAATVIELTEIGLRPAHRDRPAFELFERALDALDDPGTGSGAAPGALVVFELGFLRNAGLAPALERCAACGGPAPPVREAADAGPYGARAAFSAGAGGRLCRACADEARAAGRRVGTLPEAVLETAAELQRGGFAAGAALAALDPERIERVRDFVGRFLDYHLEARLRTHRRFLAAPNRNAP